MANVRAFLKVKGTGEAKRWEARVAAGNRKGAFIQTARNAPAKAQGVDVFPKTRKTGRLH